MGLFPSSRWGGKKKENNRAVKGVKAEPLPLPPKMTQRHISANRSGKDSLWPCQLKARRRRVEVGVGRWGVDCHCHICLTMAEVAGAQGGVERRDRRRGSSRAASAFSVGEF